MGDQNDSPLPNEPQSGIDRMVDAAGRVMNELTDEHRPVEIFSYEEFYLLDKSLLETISEPFAELGLKISADPTIMYDYATEYQYRFYRVPLAEGNLALIYLRERKTEAYQPNNNLAQLFDWLTNANPDLDIRAICFFTDGETIDAPYIRMANAWKNRGFLKFVDFVDQKTWKNLQRQDLAARVVGLKRIFVVSQLEPPAAAGPVAQPRSGGAGVGQPPVRTVADLDEDGLKKEKVIQALKNYMQSGQPTSVKLMASNLIDSTIWPDPWKDLRKSVLTENAETNARALVEYAIKQGSLFSPNQEVTALGNLLEKAKPLLSGDDQIAVDEIIQEFNLLHRFSR